MTGQHQLDEDKFRVILPENVAWKPFPAFPQGARLAVIVGHPAEPGPYVVRVKVAGGTKLMPHKHPEDRIYTVMSGVFYIGLGETFDGDKVKAYPPGLSSCCPVRPGISTGRSRENTSRRSPRSARSALNITTIMMTRACMQWRSKATGIRADQTEHIT
jgi:hypothetical protein